MSTIHTENTLLLTSLYRHPAVYEELPYYIIDDLTNTIYHFHHTAITNRYISSKNTNFTYDRVHRSSGDYLVIYFRTRKPATHGEKAYYLKMTHEQICKANSDTCVRCPLNNNNPTTAKCMYGGENNE